MNFFYFLFELAMPGIANQLRFKILIKFKDLKYRGGIKNNISESNHWIIKYMQNSMRWEVGLKIIRFR